MRVTSASFASSPSLRPFFAYRFFSACLPYLPVASMCFRARGLGLREVMALSTIYCVAVAALGIPLGALADRRGHRRSLQMASVALATGCLLAAADGGFPAILVAQLFFAAAGALEAGSDSAWLHAHCASTPGLDYRDAEARSSMFKLAGNVVGFAAGGSLAAVSPAAPFLAASVFAVIAFGCAHRLADIAAPVANEVRSPLSPSTLATAATALFRSQARRRDVVLSALTLSMARVAIAVTGPYLVGLRVSLASVGLLTAVGAALAACAARNAARIADRVTDRALFSALPLVLLGTHLAMGLGAGAAAIALALLPQIIAGVHAPVWRAHLNLGLRGEASRATVLAMDATFARLTSAVFSSLLAVVAAGGGPRAALRGCTVLGAVGLLGIALVPARGAVRSPRRFLATLPLGHALAAALAIVLALGAPGGIAKADDQPLLASAQIVKSVSAREMAPSPRFLGGDEDALVDRLCTQPITKIALNKMGTTIKFKIQLADGTRGQLRPSQRSEAGYFRADVAAFGLSRALGLHAVAPACIRTVKKADLLAAAARDPEIAARIENEVMPGSDERDDHDLVEASVTLWVPGVVSAGLERNRRAWRSSLSQSTELDAEHPADPDAVEGSRLAAWDFLIANWDRWSGANTFRAGAHGPFVWLDNAAGFGRYGRGSKQKNERQLRGVERFSRSFIGSLRALSDEELRTALAPAGLPKERERQLLLRRATLLAHVDALVERHGEDAVLCFE